MPPSPTHAAVRTYLQDLRSIRASGSAVAETSFYPALSALFNTIGATMRPRVHCILTLRNRGSGIPDGGLFTADQIGHDAPSDAFPAPIPARGVLEVKSAGDDVVATAATPQVQKYLDGYGQVLVTNYRDFLLVGRDAAGRPLPQERYTLAATEADFWQRASDPTTFAAGHRDRFTEYLTRMLLAAAPLTNPADVAWFLASYARDARSRIEGSSLPALIQIRQALEDALGISFDAQRGDHFFRSTLIQTLFYGVFSAWVLWHHERPERTDTFDWRLSQYYLHVPVLQALFSQVAAPQRLQPLGLMEVLDWTGAALNRVDRAAFFARFDTGQAVQYFYEPFLEAFDPELRRELGVWYTPPEVVRYMVARVDTALREELGVADGLADPQVYVLDPCTGTGAFMAEVLRSIAATLQARGEDALLAQDVKQAVLTRVFGFELLPAPFVVAHLQIGLLLQQLGAPLAAHERVGVYLTNALTGWAPPDPAKRAVQLQLAGLPELAQERDQAEQVKRTAPILVILGNPPYSGYAGIAQIEEERDLSHAYRTTTRAPAPQGQGLNDLYVRFFRMAERQIVENSGRGVVCYISNYSWLDGLSFTGMRERFLEVFDRIWIDNLHGDRIISEYAPDGRTSETIFAMDRFSSGIRIGTNIALMVKAKHATPEESKLLYRDVDEARASERRAALVKSLQDTLFNDRYRPIQPVADIGLPFKPRSIGEHYLSWPLLPELLPTSFPGVKTSRDDVLVDIDRERLEGRMRQYFDANISHAELAQLLPGVMEAGARFDPIATRTTLLKRGFLPENIVRYCYRPFDVRWLYWEPETKLLDEKRSEYFPHVFAGNVWLSAGQRNRKADFYQPQCTITLADHHIVESNVGMFPLSLR
ncbi:MAG TPA: N-6 DNA methylase, partial [Roseiflexaceae bacterium]|nr:N-6 DNA methylase [Roseiflexaceae bacterium]